jgi:hypothetical protein
MPPRPIDAFPKPLLSELVEGRWLPVIGAGMSLNANLAPGEKMPLWGGLGSSIASDMGTDYEYTTALEAISAYVHQFSRTQLVERLSDLLHVDSARPGDAHQAFCSIKFPVVCTTNFDFLLERQYNSIPRYCRPVMYEDQLSIPSREPGVILLKLHGDVHHPDRLVATEEDYDGFLQRYPLLATYLANLLITKTAVFIGYSLDDPDFRQVFQLIIDRLGKSRRPAYAIRVGGNLQEIARFERRGVRVINIPGSKARYSRTLTDLFNELRQYQEAGVISASQVTDEAALRELQLPPGAPTRLCYFAVPFAFSSSYKESLFPIAEQYGFVPITAETVVSPGDSATAKIDAVLGKSSLAVVDASSEWTEVELRIATSRLGTQRVLVILGSRQRLAVDVEGVTVLRRPEPPFSYAVQFLEQVSKWFSARADAVEPALNEEPERLLEVGLPRAAVITAMTLLEVQLRQNLGLTLQPTRPMSMRQLAALAVENQVIASNDLNDIQKWSQLRNAAVHTAKPVTRREAEVMIRGIRRLIERLRR